MRADMFKVIVEAGRGGGGLQGKARKFRNSEEAPVKLGIRSGYRSRKWARDSLNPLYRYLHSQVGRPWNKIYSEICDTVDVRSTVQQHLRLHVDQFVELEVKLVGNEVYSSTRYGMTALRPGDLFVHPRTSLLLEKKRRPRDAASRRKPTANRTDRRVLDAQRQLHLIDGQWYLVQVAQLPQPSTVTPVALSKADPRKHTEPRWDVVLKVTIRGQNVGGQELYGDRQLYAVSKRQLSSRELRRYGLENALAEDGD